MIEARSKVIQTCKDGGWVFFEAVTEEKVINSIEEGIRICGCSNINGEAIAKIGREHTRRTIPV